MMIVKGGNHIFGSHGSQIMHYWYFIIKTSFGIYAPKI